MFRSSKDNLKYLNTSGDTDQKLNIKVQDEDDLVNPLDSADIEVSNIVDSKFSTIDPKMDQSP